MVLAKIALPQMIKTKRGNYGSIERFAHLPGRTEKVLADTHADHVAFIGSSHCHWWRDCRLSLYLHSVLGEIMEPVQKTKAQLTIVTGFALLSVIFHIKFLLFTAIAVGLLSLIFPSGGDIIVKIWARISDILGSINSKIILSFVYLFILLPVSLLYRLFNKNLLQRDKVDRDTYFSPRDYKYTAQDFEKIW